MAGHDLRLLHAGRGQFPGGEAQDVPRRNPGRPRQRRRSNALSPRWNLLFRDARLRRQQAGKTRPRSPADAAGRLHQAGRLPDLGDLLEKKNIQGMVTDFSAERVDAAARKLVCYDGREVAFDLLVTVLTNMGSEMIERSGMGNEFRFLLTDPNTLRAKKYPNVFALGDAYRRPGLQGRPFRSSISSPRS
ncbi:MAG: hypothetical protein MZV63_06245 [Marinilabiliales bacterium]|nr:hypothetical protein [Marinilabiliales bacterium]